MTNMRTCNRAELPATLPLILLIACAGAITRSGERAPHTSTPPSANTILVKPLVDSRSTLDMQWNVRTPTDGGLPGAVLRVTTLDADGPGSLRQALEATGPRLVVFEV